MGIGSQAMQIVRGFFFSEQEEFLETFSPPSLCLPHTHTHPISFRQYSWPQKAYSVLRTRDLSKSQMN